MLETQTDVLIVGAGPVGMTLALTLRRAGVNVLLADREKEPGHATRAAIVWPRTLEILDLLGIAEGWTREGVLIERVHFTVDNNPATLQVKRMENDSPFLQPIGIGQDVTERLLNMEVRKSGVDYRRGVEMIQLTIEEASNIATLRDDVGNEQQVRAAWVIGCDGSQSRVRETAGIPRTGSRNAGVQLLQGDFRVHTSQTLVPREGYLYVGAGKFTMLLLLPLSHDGHYRVLVAQPDDGSREIPTLEQIQQTARMFLPDLTLTDMVWRSRYRTQHQIADHYRKGQVFVVGDAAHVWVPVGGQGMNIGMQDAFDLGWKLAGVINGELSDAALDTYETERRPIGERNIADTERVYGAILDTNSWEDALLRRLLPFALSLSPVTDRMLTRASGLDLHYPPSLLVAKDQAGPGKIKTGMLAPNTFVSRMPEGETLRLHDLLRPGSWVALGWVLQKKDAASLEHTLQTFSATRFPVATYLVDATRDGITNTSIPVLRDLPHLAVDAYQMTHPGIYLLRPDGVVAWRGEVTSAPSSLVSMIEKMGHVPKNKP